MRGSNDESVSRAHNGFKGECSVNPVKRAIIRLLHVYFRFSRGMTLGVRAACFDEEGRIFLVRHTYLAGWYLPGGGVEVGETAFQALVKELREEGNLEVLGAPALLQSFLNLSATKRDHVLLYRVDVRQTVPRPPDHEIAESGFFALDQLPDGLTAATRRRLDELARGGPYADVW
ncbi:NUDIX domain-containing protein [Allorhizobium sonneratiae]|uniref:NUDIX domain-containing protein n=1 Tax=Allorhizobium sonneratiae TaxID=2934936 RepID=UPI003B845EAD